jgi:beta-galactosidase
MARERICEAVAVTGDNKLRDMLRGFIPVGRLAVERRSCAFTELNVMGCSPRY